jgi:multidrug efflux pump subunit AcrA (membrane-fusion protein)
MSNRARASWLVYALGALSAGAVVAAVLVVGPAPASQSSVTRTATAAQGVVQSTVSGSGNLQPATELDLGFKTSGTVTQIYVTQGQHVTAGQLIATLDPQSAEVALEQAKATLQSAEASLSREEETDGESSSQGTGSGGASAAAASVTPARAAAAGESAQTTTGAGTTGTGTASPTGTSTTPATPTAPTTTTPAATTTPASTTTPTTTTRKSSSTTSQGESGSSSSTSKSTLSTATREANIASARAAVKSDRLNVRSAEESLQDTNLYAPESGTIASLSGQVGEVVSGGGTTRDKSSSSSESSSSTGTGSRAASAAASSSSSSAGASGSSSSTFAVLSDLSSMQLVVPLSESEIGSVRVGQVATVTVEALEGRKLAAHVSEISLLSTSNSGVVSYDVTFQLDQLTSGIRPGMSASAEVVVKQAEGVNVPTSAITADSVTVLKDGKRSTRRVVTGLAGNSSTIVLSGLSAGETVVLPSISTTSGSSTRSGLSSLRSSLRGAAGAGAIGAGGGGFPGGGAAFFRGGG